MGEIFVAGVKMLYAGASCLVKVAGGLCRLVPLGWGIQQGCPLSGHLYTVAIEMLLALLHRKDQGGVGLELGFKAPIVVSTYADDVSVLVKNDQDLQAVMHFVWIKGPRLQK